MPIVVSRRSFGFWVYTCTTTSPRWYPSPYLNWLSKQDCRYDVLPLVQFMTQRQSNYEPITPVPFLCVLCVPFRFLGTPLGIEFRKLCFLVFWRYYTIGFAVMQNLLLAIQKSCIVLKKYWLGRVTIIYHINSYIQPKAVVKGIQPLFLEF